jgi:hypothetical protein
LSFRVVSETTAATNHSRLGLNLRSDRSFPCTPDARTCTQYPESFPSTRTARCNIFPSYGTNNSDARTSWFHQTYFLFSTASFRGLIDTQQHSLSPSRGLAFPLRSRRAKSPSIFKQAHPAGHQAKALRIRDAFSLAEIFISALTAQSILAVRLRRSIFSSLNTTPR